MKFAHALAGYGLAAAFFSACAGVDGPGQFIFFVFGIVWGRMLMETDRRGRVGGPKAP